LDNDELFPIYNFFFTNDLLDCKLVIYFFYYIVILIHRPS